MSLGLFRQWTSGSCWQSWTRWWWKCWNNLYFQGYGRGAGNSWMAAIKFVGWIQSFSDLLHAVRALKCYRRLAPRMSRGPLPIGSCSRSDWCGDGGERRGVCSDARCPTRGVPLGPASCATGRLVRSFRPLPGSGASSSAFLHLHSAKCWRGTQQTDRPGKKYAVAFA